MLSSGRKELLAATFLATVLLEVAASPSPYGGFPLDDIRRPVYRGNMRTRDLKPDTEVIVKSDISVVGAEDGRAASGTPYPPMTSTPMAESMRTVTKQLLQAPGATDMVATDVRTPPRVKSQVKPQEVAETDFVPMGKGEAQPVALEEISAYEIITAPPAVKQSTQPTEGLSTWILLSNGEQSTLATSKKKVTTHPTVDPKKNFKPTMATPTIEKVKKPEDPKTPKPTHKPVALPLKKENSTKNDTLKGTPVILQDPKFKNKTPVVVGKVPVSQDKTETPTKKVVTQATTPFPIMTRKRPITFSPTPPTRHVYDLVPTTSLLVETDTIDTSEDTATAETATKSSTRRPSTNKKRKKNKNKRRRPAKPESETAESKVEETSVAPNTKIEPNARPISTRIYNYLAREVMPTVGVGLVGLVLTAGLAGLFLYPFGGGIARRNYEKGSGPVPDHQMYYYNSYAPHPGQDHMDAQPEESIFGQAMTNHNGFSPSYDPGKYSVKNKYRYDAQDYSPKENDYNVNGYAGSDYSTLPDSVKNGDYLKTDYTNTKISDYSVKPDYETKMSDYSVKTPNYSMKNVDYPKTSEYSMKNPDYSMKNAEYAKTSEYSVKTPDYTKTSEYSIKPEYSVSDKVKQPDYVMPEASKYYSMDPMSTHYKLTDSAAQIDDYKLEEHRFPSLTEYSSYTNPSSIGTANSYTNKDESNDTLPVVEDKSDKSQPHFSALVGSPQFTNTDFVGSVSLTSGYGAQDNVVRHRTGALAIEHGPRNLKLPEENKNRTKRDVHDDFSNEIDGSENKFDQKHPSTSSHETTTVKYLVESTTHSGSSKDATTTSDENSTDSHDSEITTHDPNSVDSSDKDPFTPNNPSEVGTTSEGFLSFITRLAQMKLKLGISLLRTTSEAFTRYLNVVAKRMEEAVRTIENRKRVTEQKRQRRDLSKIPQKRRRFRRKNPLNATKFIKKTTIMN